jgi:murein DD-endopeptidase MepM/ murein hydrolase activator NlpD
MMDRYFTFLYVRRGNAGVRSIRIHRLLAMTCAAVVLALFVISVSLIVKYAGYEHDSARLAALERENRDLRERISGFQHKIDQLERRMAVNFEQQNHARLLASLEPISPDVWDVGVGGPEPLAQSDIRAGGHAAMRLEGELDKLVRQSQLQFNSYREIVDILEKKKKIRDSTPSVRPLKGGYLSSRFGRRMDPFTGRISYHRGIDYHARTGTPVMSTADGIVTMAKKKGSFGLAIEVNHGNGFKTRYAHLSKMLVKRGQRVKRGDIIGLVGNTGLSTGSHLHYEVIFRKVHRNPIQYIIPEDVYYD